MPIKKVYISGKISGIEETAPALFEASEQYLRNNGYEPVNPLTITHAHDKSWHSYMREDIRALCECDAIYLLANWHDSRGAMVEYMIAQHLELTIMHQHKQVTI